MIAAAARPTCPSPTDGGTVTESRRGTVTVTERPTRIPSRIAESCRDSDYPLALTEYLFSAGVPVYRGTA